MHASSNVRVTSSDDGEVVFRARGGERVVIAGAPLLEIGDTHTLEVVVEADRARRRAIEIGQRAATEVQVMKGLDERAQVILHPSDQGDDGVRVSPL